MQLLDRLPIVSDNKTSVHGPLVACDRGYGKLSVVNMLLQSNFKVITIGSQHPIVGTEAVTAYRDKLRRSRNGIQSSDESDGSDVIQSELDSFDNDINKYVLEDDEKNMLGPAIKIACHKTTDSLYAAAVRDIFDKKSSQKVIRFFIAGFPSVENLLTGWVAIPKPRDV
jgi:hypothetical protein